MAVPAQAAEEAQAMVIFPHIYVAYGHVGYEWAQKTADACQAICRGKEGKVFAYTRQEKQLVCNAGQFRALPAFMLPWHTWHQQCKIDHDFLGRAYSTYSVHSNAPFL